jgi:hypothetical protein
MGRQETGNTNLNYTSKGADMPHNFRLLVDEFSQIARKALFAGYPLHTLYSAICLKCGRKRHDPQPCPAQFHGETWVEYVETPNGLYERTYLANGQGHKLLP